MSEVRIYFDEVERALKLLSVGQVESVLLAAVNASYQSMLRDVILNRMSGQYLGVVTGTARRSMRGRSSKAPGRVRAEFGSPLDYVRAHEEGFSGDVSVRAHTRTRGSSTHSVRAHSRQVNMRARRFMKDTLDAESRGGKESRFGRRVHKALLVAIRDSRVPNAGQLGVS